MVGPPSLRKQSRYSFATLHLLDAEVVEEHLADLFDVRGGHLLDRLAATNTGYARNCGDRPVGRCGRPSHGSRQSLACSTDQRHRTMSTTATGSPSYLPISSHMTSTEGRPAAAARRTRWRSPFATGAPIFFARCRQVTGPT